MVGLTLAQCIHMREHTGLNLANCILKMLGV